MEAIRRRPELRVAARAPKFFKIITVPDANRLRIPSEFMRRYKHNLPDRVFLQAPGGPLIKVELIRSNGQTWMDKGWQRFRDYHSIAKGNFLLFGYDRRSGQFNVVIFDTSSNEIQYQAANHENVRNVNVAAQRLVPKTEDVEMESDDDSASFKEQLLCSKKGKRKNLETADRKEINVLTGENRSISYSSSPDEHMRGIPPEMKQTKASLKKKIRDHLSNEHMTVTEDSNTEDSTTEDSQTEEIAYESDNCSPKFEIVLKNYSGQSVHMDFAKKAGLMSAKSVTLEYPPKERYWSVLLEKRSYKATFKLELAVGWRNFCKENQLEIGKTYSLVFDEGQNVIQVQHVEKNLKVLAKDDIREQRRKRPEVRKNDSKTKIFLTSSFHLAQDYTNEKGTVHKQTSIAYRRAQDFKSTNTIQHLSFVCFMKPSYLSSSPLSIPMTVLRDNYQEKKNSVKLFLNGKMWPAVCSHQQRNASLHTGWKRFREDNELKLGDACVFELNKSKKHVWNVTIFRC